MIDATAAARLTRALHAPLDAYTVAHQLAVARLAVRIGGELGLEGSALDALRLGASLHDVGKSAVPLEVLQKAERLTDADWELIREHPGVGAVLAGELDCPDPIVRMVREHHERLDGSGYPGRLRGHEVLLASRVIAVADAFDASAFDRPYRAGIGAGAGLDMLRRGSGSLFDPEVVAALESVLDDSE